MSIHTSVIITTHDRSSFLINTLNGYKHHMPYDGTELVLVDNGSSDDMKSAVDLARRIFDRVRYIRIDASCFRIPFNRECNNPSLGLNIGARHSRGRLLVFTCPECYPLEDNIHILQSITNKGEMNSYLFGKALKAISKVNEYMDGGWYPMNENELLGKIPNAIDHCVVSEENGKRGPYPFLAALPKSVFENVNGIDEEFVRGFGFEDDDLSMRIHRSGTKWGWTNRCVVLHQNHPRVPYKKDDYDRNYSHYQDNQTKKIIKANTYPYGKSDVIEINTIYSEVQENSLKYTAAGSVPWKLIQIKEKAVVHGKIMPVHIQINPTNVCNGSCSWCFCRDRDRSKQLDYEEITKILSYYKSRGTLALTLSGGGEPTLHPRIGDILRYSYDNGIRIGLTTNGLISSESLAPIINKTVDWVRISTMENHLNKGQEWEIDQLVSRLSVNTGISFTVSSDSSLDLAKAICKMANRHDHVSHIRFVDNIYSPSDEMMEKVKSSCVELTEKGIYQFRSKYKRGKKICYVSKLRPLIDSDGLIYPCCGIHYAMKDNVKMRMPTEFSMGRWDEYDLREPFDGSKCDRCYYDDYNMVIEGMLAPLDNLFHI